jgi:hypothetical protein
VSENFLEFDARPSVNVQVSRGSFSSGLEKVEEY